MIVIFYGTSAELIKLYGIIKDIPRDQQFLICTAQQYAGLQRVHKQLGIEPDLYISKGWRRSDVANMRQMTGMMLKAHGSFAANFLKIKKSIKSNERKYKTKSIALVHGDTLTTVVGSYLGLTLGIPVAHVEAGLRSGSWKNPFPEEMDRRVVAKFARIHFPPNELAEDNLRGERAKGIMVNTTFNTAKDAIEVADKFVSDDYYKLKLPDHYCLVLLHRTELLENKSDFEEILKVLRAHADKKNRIVFTEHTTTREKLKYYGFDHYLEHPFITTIPKQPYFDFMAIVKNSDYLVTDGGGLQEDAYFLGIPVVVHRQRTERQEGIGFNASLSKMDTKKVADFLDNHKNKEDFAKLRDNISPSKIVVDYLASNKFYSR